MHRSTLDMSDDSVWNNPNELDLVRMTRSDMLSTRTIDTCSHKILPCLRRLIVLFDRFCPNIYRIHCSDSLRILQEMICLIHEYLHIHPLLTRSLDDLLDDEQHLNEFIIDINNSAVCRSTMGLPMETGLHYYGHGIDMCHEYNELHRMLVFCFEWTTTSTTNDQPSRTIDVLIVDPNDDIVPVNIQHISTSNHGYTKLYSCSYTPMSRAGIYSVTFLFHRMPINPCPLAVLVRDIMPMNFFRRNKTNSFVDKHLTNNRQGKCCTKELHFIFILPVTC
jgi:hypothetical protein